VFDAGKFGGFAPWGFGGPGFGGVGGFGGPGYGGAWGLGGVTGPGFGGGWGGAPGFGGLAEPPGGPGYGGPFKKAAVVGALLLDGPADAAGVVKRLSKASNGAIKPPKERTELLLAVMAGKGVVTLDNGEATLTELGRNLLAWRRINADTARAMLARAEKFADVVKIRRELKATAGLARRIAWMGTAEQKKTLKKAKASILAAIREAQHSLHASLAVDTRGHGRAAKSPDALSDR
jgi:hypothetical protein